MRTPAYNLCYLIVIALLVAACTPSRPELEPADLVLVNGRVLTVDPDRPEARAVAIRGDRIVAVGESEDVERFRGKTTRTIELDGKLLVPGFIESHGHLMQIGQARAGIDLVGTTSYAAIVDRVASAVSRADPGAWISGRGWHQSKWETLPSRVVDGFQTHEPLSAVSPDNPIVLTHASGHALLANAAAMRLAGVTAETVVPDGGEIIRDQAGQPTGIFIESAQRLVLDALEADRDAMPPELVEAQAREALRLATREVLSQGITTFHDAGVEPRTLSFFEAALDRGELGVRLYVMLVAPLEKMSDLLPTARAVGLGDHRLTVRAIKLMLDGALGSRGAWLLEPYADMPGTSGMVLTAPAQVGAVAELALRHGYQLAVHAIGDRANRELLDVYEVALAAAPEQAADARFRIEHVQVVAPEDIPRFSKLGVIASVQGIHATADGSWTPNRLGPLRSAERAYQFRRLLDSGAVVVNGSDAPIEEVDPIASFYASVTLGMADGSTFNPGQQMTREEALFSYTQGAAYASFEEELKGSITPGKLADLVVLSRDIMRVPAEEIPGTRVLYTILGGEVVFEADRLE